MGPTPTERTPRQQVGRYAIFDEIAAGGMATVHLARFAGPLGFARVVAAKRLHRHLVSDDDFKRMFLDEARLAARIRHPNVVPTLDVLVHAGEIIQVMEYVHGESLFALHRAARERKTPVPLPVAAAILVSILHGLHAAHEARNEKGEPLQIVHRDVSPHNVLVGEDGAVRVLDFGVAKAIQARVDTRPGTLKGKFSFMAPEVLRGDGVTRQADVFSAAVVFWELLTDKKLFVGMNEHERMQKILAGRYPAPSTVAPHLPRALDRIVMKALEPDLSRRYRTALEMAVEIENKLTLASQRVVGEWVNALAAETLDHRSELLQQIEISHIHSVPPAAVEGGVGRKTLGAEDQSWSAYPWAHTSSKSRSWVVGGLATAAMLAMVGATLLRSKNVATSPALAQPTTVATLDAPPPSVVESPSAPEGPSPASSAVETSMSTGAIEISPAQAPSRQASTRSAPAAHAPLPSQSVRKVTARPRPAARPSAPPTASWPQGNARTFLPDDL